MVRYAVVGVSLFLAFLSVSIVSASILDDEFATIRQRVLEASVWPQAGNISEVVQLALNYSHTLNSTCYWPDLNYDDQSLVEWSPAKHMYRITGMLQAITVNGSTIKNDPKIMSQVHCALQVWFDHDWLCPNWWDNEILIPLQATSQLLMLGENATQTEVEKITEISYRAAWWLHRKTDSGTNLIQMIQSELYRSLMTKNITGLQQGFSRMWQDIAVQEQTVQGIQMDWSYHFHGLQLMTGAYGIEWTNTMLLFLYCSQNTSYQPNNSSLSILSNFVTLGHAWMVITDYWDWNVVGRNIAGPGNGFPTQLKVNLIRSLAEVVESNETRVQILNFADRLENKPNTPLLIGNRHFFDSDYQVHRRADWIFTIKMQSNRTTPAECLNGENLKDEHGGQGVLNLYKMKSNDYLDVFPLIDWQAINGITVEYGIPLENCTRGTFPLQNSLFVGGASDGLYGLAMMDTLSHDLTARRSWHFYDDGVMAFATNLTLRTNTTAWTTLASRLLPSGQVSIGFFNSTIVTLKDGNYTFPYTQGKTTNVQWIHLGQSNIAYVLPLAQSYASVGVQVGMKTGNYDTFSPFNVTVTERMTTLYIDHGVGPYTLDYNYMILPNVLLESVPTMIKQYTDEQVFACISTNGNFHGTMWPSLKRAAFVLWENVTTAFSCKSPTFDLNIELNNAGAFIYSENATAFTLTASHPIIFHTALNVTVDRVGTGKACTVPTNGDPTKTEMTVPLGKSHTSQGISFTVSCTKQSIDE